MRGPIIPALVHQSGLSAPPLLSDTRAIAVTGIAAVRTYTFIGPYLPQSQARSRETYRHRSSRTQSFTYANGAIPCRTTEEQWFSKEVEKTIDEKAQGDQVQASKQPWLADMARGRDCDAVGDRRRMKAGEFAYEAFAFCPSVQNPHPLNHTSN